MLIDTIVPMNERNAPGDTGRDATMALRFWSDAVLDQKTGQWSDVDFVEWFRRGATIPWGNTCRVDRVKRDFPEIWPFVEKHYARWREGQEDPVDGTPLTAWAGVTPAQVRMLQVLHLRSVEDIAALTDANAQQIMGGRDLRQRAKAFLASMRDHGEVVQRQAELEAALTGRDERIKELAEAAAAMKAELDELRPRQAKGGASK